MIIYGARQVGKTTLIKKIMDVCDIPSKYLNYDEPGIRESLSNKTSTELSQLIGSNKLVLIERYVVPKAFRDNYPDADVHLVNRDNYMDFLL